MTEASEPVLLARARTPAEAQIMVAVLRGAGVPAHVDEANRYDELAVSQRLLNLDGVQVFVPQARLAEAKVVLEEARASGDFDPPPPLPEDGPVEAEVEPTAPSTPAPRPSAFPRVLNFVLGLALVGVVVEWLTARAALAAATSSRHFHIVKDGNVLRYVSRETGQIAFEYEDRDRDGDAEVIRAYSPAGVLVSTTLDEDADGYPEKSTVHFADGSRAVWTEGDENGLLSRREGYDAKGTLVRVDLERSGSEIVRVR